MLHYEMSYLVCFLGADLKNREAVLSFGGAPGLSQEGL